MSKYDGEEILVVPRALLDELAGNVEGMVSRATACQFQQKATTTTSAPMIAILHSTAVNCNSRPRRRRPAPDQNAIYAVARDITDFKQMVAQLPPTVEVLATVSVPPSGSRALPWLPLLLDAEN